MLFVARCAGRTYRWRRMQALSQEARTPALCTVLSEQGAPGPPSPRSAASVAGACVASHAGRPRPHLLPPLGARPPTAHATPAPPAPREPTARAASVEPQPPPRRAATPAGGATPTRTDAHPWGTHTAAAARAHRPRAAHGAPPSARPSTRPREAVAADGWVGGGRPPPRQAAPAADHRHGGGPPPPSPPPPPTPHAPPHHHPAPAW